MEYAMRIIIPVGEQIFCSWLFHMPIIYIKTSKANLDARKFKFFQKPESQIIRRLLSE
jgi:hypothetical protein